MKTIKNFLTVVLLLIAFISFIVMIVGFVFYTAAVGFISAFIFGTSLIIAMFLGMPDDDDKRFIRHRRPLGC